MNYEKLRRSIRRHPALWGELGEAKEKQADRILKATGDKLRNGWNERTQRIQNKRMESIIYL